jgi:hypothetical protein
VADTEWQADAAIAVLLAGRPPQQQPAAVLVEIGVAVGRHVPTLILSKGETQLPSLAGVPRIDADLHDVDTMALKVELFLQGVREKSPTKFPASAGRPVSPLTRGSLRLLSSLELEEAVGQLLQLSGSEFIREGSSSRRETADFVLHVENNESDLGLVLIEVR